jgi:hypothetical protein
MLRQAWLFPSVYMICWSSLRMVKPWKPLEPELEPCQSTHSRPRKMTISSAQDLPHDSEVGLRSGIAVDAPRESSPCGEGASPRVLPAVKTITVQVIPRDTRIARAGVEVAVAVIVTVLM